MAVVFKSYEIVLIRIFFHAEFISALKTEPKSMVFEKYAKNGKRNCNVPALALQADVLLY